MEKDRRLITYNGLETTQNAEDVVGLMEKCTKRDFFFFKELKSPKENSKLNMAARVRMGSFFRGWRLPNEAALVVSALK